MDVTRIGGAMRVISFPRYEGFSSYLNGEA